MRAPGRGQARGESCSGTGKTLPDSLIGVRSEERGNLLILLCQDGGQGRQFAGDTFDQERLGGDHGRVGGQRLGLREQM